MRICYHRKQKWLGVFLLNQKFVFSSLIVRLLFFVVNFYFIVEVVSAVGWNFIALILVSFATRDLVHSIRIGQVLYFFQKNQDSGSDDNHSKK